jgi:hypothetical protein
LPERAITQLKILDHGPASQFQIAQSGELLRAFGRLFLRSLRRPLRVRRFRRAAQDTNQERDAQCRFHIPPFLRDVSFGRALPKTLPSFTLLPSLGPCEYTRTFWIFHTEYLKIRPQSEMLFFLLRHGGFP